MKCVGTVHADGQYNISTVTLHNNESTALTTQKRNHSAVMWLFYRMTGYCIRRIKTW